MWRKLRILVLLLILLVVALNQYFDRVYSTDWNTPLRVTVYPIDGDGSAVTEQFIKTLAPDRFQALEGFFEREASFRGVTMDRPIQFKSAPQLRELPPALARDANVFSIMWWSLRMRYWAWQSPDVPGVAPDIKLFVVYHDPALSPTPGPLGGHAERFVRRGKRVCGPIDDRLERRDHRARAVTYLGRNG